MKDIIRGFKTLGIIGGLLLQGALESMANTYEENKEYTAFKEEGLEDQWKHELYYYSNERLEQELKNCFLYNWSVDYDGRCKCIDRIAEFKAKNNYKIC